MTHRDVLRLMPGLMLALFIAALSGTILANALPRIIDDLDGEQNQYTWVITANLLAATAATPLWGKLADRLNRKRLFQASITIFATGSALSGFAPSAEALIAFRVVEGIGMSGVAALVQVVLASITSPRAQGAYAGYLAGVAGVATVAGPFLGGYIVDAPSLGWRWCFWFVVPLSVVALVLLQKTLHLPVVSTDAATDWAGALVIPTGVSLLLIWITLAGHRFSWLSTTTVILVGSSSVLLALAVMIERRAHDPVVPPRIVRQPTVLLAICGSLTVGIAMYAASVFLAQYLQVARAQTPTQSGLLTLPMVIATLGATTVSGRLVSRDGRWKRHLLAGTGLIAAGSALLGVVDPAADLWLVSALAAVLGAGIGATTLNLTLAVRNLLDYRELGAATSTMIFFRSLGGAAGVAVLGAVFTAHVADACGTPGGCAAMTAHGEGTSQVFLIIAVIAVAGVVAAALMQETPLRAPL